MTPSIKHKYKRRGKAPPIGSSSLRRSYQRPTVQNSNTTFLRASSFQHSTTTISSSSFSSNTETTHTLSLEKPLESFADMVLSHEEADSRPPSSTPMTVDELPREDEPSPENMATAEGSAIEEEDRENDGTGTEVVDLEEDEGQSDPPIASSPATATISSPPATMGAKTEVKSFDLNKPPGDWMKVVGDFDSLFCDKPYYTTMLNGKTINIYKPPHLYIKNSNLAKPILGRPKFEIGSGSGTSAPKVVPTAGGHGLTHGLNTRGTSPPIHAIPLRSVPPNFGRLFDVLGIPPEFEHFSHKPSLSTYQMSLINNLAKTTPGNPHIDFSSPFSPPPTGGMKRPSGVVFKENPSMKKVFKEQPINAFQFESWKMDQDRQRLLAVEKAEKRVYTQLWGTISTLQKQCMDQAKKIMDMEQQIADHGLSDFEKKDMIDNLEMLLGLAIKSLKMDARELMKLKNLDQGKSSEDGNKSGISGKSSMHDITFGSFTPDELNVLYGKERLKHLNFLLQKVGGGVGCSELEIVAEGCCNRLIVSGNLESLDEEEDERKKERKTENSEEEKKQKEEGSNSKGRSGKKKKAVFDGKTTTTTEPACDPTPWE